jgi:hypothetical protein
MEVFPLKLPRDLTLQWALPGKREKQRRKINNSLKIFPQKTRNPQNI